MLGQQDLGDDGGEAREEGGFFNFCVEMNFK